MASQGDRRPKTVLITGCSQGGIGNALARNFLARGFRVFATARNLAAVDDLSAIGVDALSLNVDSEKSIQQCCEQVGQLSGGRLDYLINNAGVNCTIPALDVDIDDARRCFETNFFAVVRLVQVFAPMIIKARGTIVMIGSLASAMPYVFGSIYNASKAAVLSYADTLRVELAPFGVSVITVMTGGVKSQLTNKVQRYIPENSLYTPIREEFSRRKVHSAEAGIETEAYAETVIQQLLPGAGPWPWRWFMRDARRSWIWAGGKSTVVWLLTGGWLQHGLFDWYFTRSFNLSKLRPKKLKSG